VNLDFFRRAGVIYPELCYITSVAVGFPVAVYQLSAGAVAKGKRYQIMRWDDDPGPGFEFWDWYLYEKPQFFTSPVRAAAVFVQEWQRWSKRHAA
jgi:hypothetical protein